MEPSLSLPPSSPYPHLPTVPEKGRCVICHRTPSIQDLTHCSIPTGVSGTEILKGRAWGRVLKLKGHKELGAELALWQAKATGGLNSGRAGRPWISSDSCRLLRGHRAGGRSQTEQGWETYQWGMGGIASLLNSPVPVPTWPNSISFLAFRTSVRLLCFLNKNPCYSWQTGASLYSLSQPW